ncbi:hypothetical protein [Legionella tunisiensis]|uniref:hypothetical protein n=1 Tax=Legionella tunisiensis TaxID=1034944 RepID=UPI000313D21F|nr:hypothetical protein [Legionella tunisiensis]
MILIDEKEAFAIVEQFNFLNASRAPISKFIDIIDIENFEIRVRGLDIVFKGIAGFADHQINKLSYFDQKFDCELQKSTQKGNEIILNTKGVWYASTWSPPAAYSQQLIADLSHTWRLAKKTEKAPLIIVSHSCETFAYRKGYSPRDVEKEFHLKL